MAILLSFIGFLSGGHALSSCLPGQSIRYRGANGKIRVSPPAPKIATV